MRKLFLILALMISFSLIFAGCSSNELVKVRLNEVTHSVFYAPQYVAMSQGFFKDEGLDIELTNGQGADKVMTAVLSDK